MQIQYSQVKCNVHGVAHRTFGDKLDVLMKGNCAGVADTLE